MLIELDHLPDGLLDCEPGRLVDILGGPALIHLPGRHPEPLFVSVLLHGNEEVGWRAVQRVLRRALAPQHELHRSLSLLIGNVAAARADVRRLPGQPDFNRVWPGADDEGTAEHAMMRRIVATMRDRKVFASVDLHNNTGWNPHYTCVKSLDRAHLHLAALFGSRAVYFERPHGVQTGAFAPLCPSVTCECGKVGDADGVRHAEEFLDACLRLTGFPERPLRADELELYHSIATLRVAPEALLEFASGDWESAPSAPALRLRPDLDHWNFRELAGGTLLGRMPGGGTRQSLALRVEDHDGRDVTEYWLERDAEQGIRMARPAIPAMLTCNIPVIRQDCLGYLMERLPSPPTNA